MTNVYCYNDSRSTNPVFTEIRVAFDRWMEQQAPLFPADEGSFTLKFQAYRGYAGGMCLDSFQWQPTDDDNREWSVTADLRIDRLEMKATEEDEEIFDVTMEIGFVVISRERTYSEYDNNTFVIDDTTVHAKLNSEEDAKAMQENLQSLGGSKVERDGDFIYAPTNDNHDEVYEELAKMHGIVARRCYTVVQFPTRA